MAKQLKLSVQNIVNNAMAAKLELGDGELAAHVGCAFDDYCARHQLDPQSAAATDIVLQLNELGFKW